MKRMLKTLMILILSYFLPLIFVPELMLNYKIIITAIACATMLLTQPDFKTKEANKSKQTDKNSMLFILLAGLFSQVIPVIEWGYFGAGANGYNNIPISIIGLVMLVGGLAFRIWSIRYLGKYFTATVQIVDKHQIVQSGPYAIVRHPSYLGAYVAIVGSALFLNTIIGTITSALIMAIAYKYRITAEEKALINEFGDEYCEYVKAMPKIIPIRFSRISELNIVSTKEI